MRLAKFEGVRLDTFVRLDCDRIGPFRRRTIAVAIAVVERILRIVKRLFPNIDDVRRVYRVAPTQILVVPERREWRARECCTREIPAAPAVMLNALEVASGKLAELAFSV